MNNPISQETNDLVVIPQSPPTLEQLERKIEVGLRVLRQTFFEVGLALKMVKERELYLSKGYSNYVAYCTGEWKLNKSYAYDLLKAADVVTNLIPQIETNPQNFSAIAEKLNYPLPQNESQCRELAKLKNSELQKQVWDDVVNSTSEAKITAVTIRKAIALRQTSKDSSHNLSIPPLETVVRIVGSNPDLAHLHNCWGIVVEVRSHSVDVATCLGDAIAVHPQYLMVLKGVDEAEAAAVLERVKAIASSSKINHTVRNLLQEIATQPSTQLNQWQQIYLRATEEVVFN